MIIHPWKTTLSSRFKEPRFERIQILLGPRQTGKTTSLLQLQKEIGTNLCVLSSADLQQHIGVLWIEQQWEKARRVALENGRAYLFLDEIQKISNWSEAVKKLWDEDKSKKNKIYVCLTGSSSLSIQSGLSESLAGRFEVVPATHGTWSDFKELTNGKLEQYIYFGCYPGSLDLISDEERWRAYVNQSIIEAVLSRDILLLARVDKPSLLRQLFHLGCEYTGQILSFNKMIGQLQDAGNSTTLSHYLSLLDQAFMLKGLQQFHLQGIRTRASSPKYQVHNNALLSALGIYSFKEAYSSPEIWGRYVESCVGTYLVNQARIDGFNVFYWRVKNDEVDFVVQKGRNKILAIEVKSGRRGKLSGLKEFKKKFPDSKTLVLQLQDGSLGEFLLKNPLDYI